MLILLLQVQNLFVMEGCVCTQTAQVQLFILQVSLPAADSGISLQSVENQLSVLVAHFVEHDLLHMNAV